MKKSKEKIKIYNIDFNEESVVVIQDKMRERCINEFNIAYGMDSKLKEKQKGKKRDITSYERKLFNERVKGLKQEISNLENEVSDLEDNKQNINNQIIKLNKDKNDITDEIDKKKKINNKIIIKSKNQLWDENEKLKEERRFKGFNLFNKKEIEKATKHINDEMDEYAEEFYNDKKDKEKDDGLER